MAKKKETFREQFDRMMADPNITESEAFKDCEKFGKAMDGLTADIVGACIDYANEHGDEDEGWANTILISLARATCKMIYALQHTAAEEGKDIFKFYHKELLPLCKEIAYRESDEMVAEAERMAKEAEEEAKDGVSRQTKNELMLAIADPDVTVDDIIARFFKKDMTADERQMVVDHINKVRREHADKLAKVREMNKGN